ncbi:YodC family protein [Bradyrhizobium sp. ORS 111]|uniref:YodC family protein n=1 Tax=Bradyrhizobium sp. ORS 111 TaxID=1685958 RepID=UPI0038907829
MELKPGDVVMLKSGGHPLTVVEVEDDKVECLWMGVDGDLFRETLPLVALESADLDPDEEEDDEEEEDEEEDDEDEDDDDDGRKKKRKAA